MNINKRKSQAAKRGAIRVYSALIVIFLFVAGAVSLSALERPTKDQLLRYAQDGSLAQRIQNALALGNHIVAPQLVRNFIRQTQELGLNPSVQSASAGNLSKASRPEDSPLLKSRGSVKTFALLISFPDYPAFQTPAAIASKLFGGGDGNWPYESLRNYYRRSSYNSLDIEGNVLGWYIPAYTRASMPQTPEARETLIEEALMFYRNQGHDFSQYDNDGDGSIDYFMVIWTGPNDGWGSFWCEYQASVAVRKISLNGIALDQTRYSWLQDSRLDEPAFDTRAAIHETGHALGLPDYNDYLNDAGSQGGFAGLDMMNGECGDHNAFSKMLLGWISPQVFDLGGGEFSLRASGSSPEALLIVPNSSSARTLDEFYLIQNRFRVENDFYFPAEGLLAWYVDARIGSDGNFLNNNSSIDKKLLRLRKLDSSFSDAAGGLSISRIGPSSLTQFFKVALQNGSSSSFTPLVSGTGSGAPSNLSSRIQALSAGATYYVDATSGSDSNNGLAQTTSWKTIDKVNRMTFLPGDSILFKRGETWREQLVVPNSGSVGNPITFGAFGTGENPIITGGSLISGWIQANNVYQITSVEPTQVFHGATRLTKNAGLGLNQWNYSGGVLSINIGMNPNGETIEVTTWSIPVQNNGQSYVTYQNLTLTKGGNKSWANILIADNVIGITVNSCEISWGVNYGVFLNGSDIVIKNSIIHDNINNGIQGFHGSSSSGHETYIQNNTVFNNQYNGIQCTSNYWIIEYNRVYDNGSTSITTAGIELFDTDGTWAQHNIVRFNLVFGQKSADPDGAGIFCDQYSAYNNIFYNITYGNNGSGFAVYQSNHDNFFNNVAYGNCQNSSGELAQVGEFTIVGSATTNIVLKNNIGYATKPSFYAVYVDPAATVGFNSTNNFWYTPNNPNWYSWNGMGGSLLATWNACTGVGTDINADPIFVNAAAKDYHLLITSPCIKAGIDVSLALDFAGNPVPASPGANPSIGAYEYEENSSMPDDLLEICAGQGVYCRNSDTGGLIQLAPVASKITAGDLDGDGIDDLIGIWPSQGGVWVKYSQSGAWTYLSSTADWIAAADMNGDGRAELLGTWTGQGVYWRNNTTGAWTQLAQPATKIVAGDLDGDGIDDLIGIWPSQGGVWVKYSQSGTWAHLSSTADWIAVGDMNGDGRDDLVGVYPGQGVYYRNSMTGQWVQMASPATMITVGDLDGDGIDDLIGIWPTQGGVWVKYSQSGTWAYLSSSADWIATGKMRAANAQTLSTGKELPLLTDGPLRISGYEEPPANSPGRKAFAVIIEKSLRPEEPGTSWTIMSRIPGPGEPGFICGWQSNLIPGQGGNNQKTNERKIKK